MAAKYLLNFFFGILAIYLYKPIAFTQHDSLNLDKRYMVVEAMPRFHGCEGLPTIKEKETCSKEKLQEFLANNLKYPEAAKKNSIEGTVVIGFTVNKNGLIVNPQILKDIGFGCGEAALELVRSMNDLDEKWIPGKQRGEYVNIEYIVPVKFKLSNND